jgi:hypothetical protein
MAGKQGNAFWQWLANATRVRNPYKVEVIVMWAIMSIPLLGLIIAVIASVALNTIGYKRPKNPSPTKWEREGPTAQRWEGEGAGHSHPAPGVARQPQ